MSSDTSMVFVTVPNKNVASNLARRIVSSKMAACVNIIPGVVSVYRWKGQIEEDDELILMIKTKTELVKNLSDFIVENHPFEVPEVISSSIENGNSKYIEWIKKTVE